MKMIKFYLGIIIGMMCLMTLALLTQDNFIINWLAILMPPIVAGIVLLIEVRTGNLSKR